MSTYRYKNFITGISLVNKASTGNSVLGDIEVLNDGNIYFHDGTVNSELLTAASTSIITNKTFIANTTLFADQADNTKTLQFSLSGAASGFKLTLAGIQTANRTITVPDITDTLVTLNATQTLTNKVLTGNTAVNLISGSGTLVLNTTGTITVPNATTTLVGKTTTDILTNKTLIDNSTIIADNSDNTIQILFNAAGTTSTSTTLLSSQTTNRILTLPNATDTLVGKATTDILTNKTLSGNTATNLISGSGTFTFNTTGTITVPSTTDTLVAKATTDVLTNKTLSGNTSSNFINGSGTFNINSTGTITVPNSTDTLVGKATTDILTNKTLSGNTATNLISGSGTTTFNTTGTITLPNATDTLVGKATTDILTNKTLTGNTAANLISGSGTLTLNTTGTITVPNATDTLVGKATTDNLTNKTFSSSATFTQISTPSSPAASNVKLYPKSDGNFYSLSSAGVESLIGSGGVGGSGKNYLTAYTASTSSNTPNPGNGNLELGTTSGWTLAHSTFSGGIPTQTASAGTAFSASAGGSAASGNLSFAVVSSGQLAGNYSGSLVSSAASVAGDMLISDAFFIDKEDQAKVLQISFYYNVNAGAANLNLSGTSSNSFAVYAYDITNGAWIQPAGVYNLVQNSGTGRCTATFQTTSNSTKYQFAIVNANASTGSYTLYLDDMFVGPQIAPAAPAASDWIAYTPTFTGYGTVSTQAFFWRRVGDSVEIKGKWTMGTTTATEARVSLPSGLTSDPVKIPALEVCGYYTRGNASLASHGGSVFIESGVTYMTFGSDSTFGSTSVDALTKQLGNDTSSTNIHSLIATIPVSGWSSNTASSSDTDTRLCAAIYKGAATTAGANQPIKFPTLVQDTHAAYSTSTGQFTAPISGDYNVSAFVDTNVASASLLQVYVNGTLQYTMGLIVAATSQGGGSAIVKVNAGDLIDIRSTINFTVAGTTCQLSISRIAGPAVINASEDVNARYFSSVTSLSGSLANITYATKDFDSHNAMSGATYTIPVSGKYQVNAALLQTAATTAANQVAQIQINKNGSAYSGPYDTYFTSTTSKPITTAISDIINCLAGDTITIQAQNAGTTPSITVSNSANYFSIARIGN